MASGDDLSARDRLRQHFLENLGRVMDGDELRPVSGNISEWARRIRELRDEEGFQILTNNDRSDLRPGQYVLISSKPKPAFARNISKETRSLVLDRNGFTCQMCGAGAGEPHPYDTSKKTRLHIGHIIDKSHGGSDDPSNLRAVCSVCNEGAANIAPDRPSASKLLAQIRKASANDQMDILEWLINKFPKQARRIVDG